MNNTGSVDKPIKKVSILKLNEEDNVAIKFKLQERERKKYENLY